MEFYFLNNIKSKRSLRKIEIDFEVFAKLIKKSALVEVSLISFLHFGV